MTTDCRTFRSNRPSSTAYKTLRPRRCRNARQTVVISMYVYAHHKDQFASCRNVYVCISSVNNCGIPESITLIGATLLCEVSEGSGQ